MVQGKKAFNNSKPKFAEVVIGDSEAKEMRVAANSRPSRSPYLKLVYPNGVTLILPADISVEQSYCFVCDHAIRYSPNTYVKKMKTKFGCNVRFYGCYTYSP